MGAKYVSGSMQGAGSVEESRLFSFDRSSICCSPTPMLFTDSCHYLRLIRFHPICQSTLFTETWTNQTFNREVSQRGLSVSACVFFWFSICWNKSENLFWSHKREEWLIFASVKANGCAQIYSKCTPDTHSAYVISFQLQVISHFTACAK